MYLDQNPVLHIVDEGTKYGAARFMPDVSTKTIWQTMLTCWALIYTGLPNRMLVDQGTAFGKLFVDIAALSNVQVDHIGIEAHSSLGLGERYHHPLRQTFRKIRCEYPDIDRHQALALAVKAMNDTLGPEGLVPSSLVFGEFPKFVTPSESPRQRSTLASQAAAALTARKEAEKHMAKLRVKRALKHATPSATEHTYQAGTQVLVWREKQVDHRIGEWLGPFKVMEVDESKKLIYVQDFKVGAARPFNIVQVKPYLTPENLALSFISDIYHSFSELGNPKEDYVYLTETIGEKDPRASCKQMSDAKKTEIRNLLSRGTFKVTLREEISPDGNVLPGRFVLTIKSTEDNEIKYKARYVIGGHRDRFKNMMVHNASTLQPQSIRLLLALAAIHDFDVWTADARQAYLQSAEPLAREVFVDKLVPEFELDKSQCLQLLKPLYGLCESGDLWNTTLDKHHKNDLGMFPLRSDPALYVFMTGGLLRGMSGSYVDDLLRAGDSHFTEIAKRTNERFDMAENEYPPCKFTGFSLSKDRDGILYQDQNAYLRKLEHLPSSASYSDFRSMRMRLAWLANTRPDCLFEISQLAQITEDIFNSSKGQVIKRLNLAVKFAVQKRVALKITKLMRESLRVIGYSDAYFANNKDSSSQLGYICFLGDDTGSVVPINFKSYKAKRITRSVMAAEVIAFSDLFDVAATLSHELSRLLNLEVPLQLFTDSKSLFDIISKGSRTSEKRTMLDIAAAREGFQAKVISDIGFVRSSHNIADGLTKAMKQVALQEVISSGHLHIRPEQWIVRN